MQQALELCWPKNSKGWYLAPVLPMWPPPRPPATSGPGHRLEAVIFSSLRKPLLTIGSRWKGTQEAWNLLSLSLDEEIEDKESSPSLSRWELESPVWVLVPLGQSFIYPTCTEIPVKFNILGIQRWKVVAWAYLFMIKRKSRKNFRKVAILGKRGGNVIGQRPEGLQRNWSISQNDGCTGVIL